ncbi:MAG TPA: TRAP transporter small permease subunit [Gammaproteobacteria bacterium]|jgi:TRAP-type mannitol/chloroaromatic compound transport system permease small subunit|nr:C4-dicarboxylate ABC transporter permease [Gammaproteobacteria bacterium]HIA58850.1 TRAP transporter small permease subunit [Gammaproteobacteria bacterium]HIF87242.1 TRAP transporter small permease subunit [Gammaproteobacteria bacterium]HIL62321.1 TRAP transporter small permease subunit [Porticoccaceae bacterium]|tara:strand:- start:19297 stop:19818 length:522 start_codon:yes stop_codon:yes gene_type:complete
MRIEKLSRLIDASTDLLGRSAAWLTVGMVLLMALIVALRYLFQTGSIAMQESVIYVNALIFTLGAAYTLKEQGHVRVDILYNRLGVKQKALVDLLGGLVFLLPFAGFIIWESWDYVSVSWRIREGSAELSGLPYVYLLKATIILLALLLIIQGISEILKAIVSIRQGNSRFDL